jgi:hypothetical protein
VCLVKVDNISSKCNCSRPDIAEKITHLVLNNNQGLEVTVFNATFNNISVISWRSVLLVEETGENHRPVASL